MPALIALCFAYAGAAHPLDKVALNDWAQFSVNMKNETTPLLSTENQQRLRVVSVVQAAGVRIDNYSTIAGKRTRMGGSLYSFNKPYEPVLSRGSLNCLGQKHSVNGCAKEATGSDRKTFTSK
jgi:hypothetical protein